MTLRHLVRAYGAHGYALYEGTTRGGFTQRQLGIEAGGVTASFLALEDRIDQALDTKALAWTMCLRRDSSETGPLIGYGGFVTIAVRERSETVVFIHALQLQSAEALPSCLQNVLQRLSPKGLSELSAELQDLVTPGVSEPEVLRRLTASLENPFPGSAIAPQERSPGRVFSIEHDCAGSSAIAWLCLGLGRVGSLPPWEVYDEVTPQGSIVTRCVPAANAKVIRASEIMGRLIVDSEPRSAERLEQRPTPVTGQQRARELPAADRNPIRADLPRLDGAEAGREGTVGGEELSLDSERSWRRGGPPRLLGLGVLILIATVALSGTALLISLRTRAELRSVIKGRPAVAAATSALTTNGDVQAIADLALDTQKLLGHRIVVGLVDSVALDGEPRRRASLTELESAWGNDPQVIAVVRERAERYKADPPAVLELVRILQHLPTEVLQANRSEVEAFLVSIEPNGPQTRKVVAEIRALMTGVAGSPQVSGDASGSATRESVRGGIETAPGATTASSPARPPG